MRGRRALVVLLLVALTVGMGPAAWSQAVPRATCLDCHEAEGMDYAVVQATPFITVPVGETQRLEVKVANPWLHEITSALVTVDLGNSTGLTFETPDPLSLNRTLSLTPQNSTNVTIPFRVQPGATGVVVRMTQQEDPTGLGAQDVDTFLTFPAADPARARPDGLPAGQDDVREPSPPRPVEAYAYDAEGAAGKGSGTWNLTVFLNDAQGTPVRAPTDVLVEVQVWYNSTRTQSRLMSEVVGPGGTGSLAFPVKGVQKGPVSIGLEAVVTTFYKHPTGIGAQDEGNATLDQPLNFTVGDTLELGEAGPAVPPTPPISWKLNARIWGEATGFIGLFLVPLSLVLGGAFGRRNVLWVNQITRSARVRVLWHNALSFFLLGISILHLLLFLYEEVYDWSVGMVWGGIGTLGLIGLAITGGFQRRFARSIGYAKWRLLHIAMAVLFVASVLVHVLVDGAHFDVFREWLGLT